MKKILLIGCAIAFFCAGAIAQVQDTSSTDLRQEQPQVQEENQNQDNSNELQRRTDEAGNEIKQETDEVKQDAEEAGNELKQDAEETKEKMEEDTDRARDLESESKPEASIENNAQPTDNAMNAPPQETVEVLEDKEGPDNQVVYKYQDGLYYVDKEKKELVKIEESQLKDAEHKAIVKEGSATSENQKDQ
jgi:Ni/Co efflux regulator RcnB